jgi:Uma2 family endonuclease
MTDPIQLKPITMADVLALEAQGISREIMDGRWVDEGDEPLAGKRHGKIGATLVRVLGNHVVAHDLGEIYQDNTTYVLAVDGDQIMVMLIPDISFVSAARVVNDNPDDPYYQAPDLAIEIISPSERYGDILDKVETYLKWGTKQVWLVYPKKSQIVVYLPDNTSTLYNVSQTISGGDMLPGLALSVASVFGS